MTVYVELTLYLGLGLAVLLVWDTVMEHMHSGELMLIAGESPDADVQTEV